MFKNHTEKSKRLLGLVQTKGRDIWIFIPQMIKMYKNGFNSYQIAEKFKVSRSFVTTSLKKNGVKLRPAHASKGIVPWNKGKEYLAIRGCKNPNWKGGITPLNQQVRHCLEYKKWYKTIFIRDNYTCQKCGNRGGNLEVDHNPKTFCQIMFDNKIQTLQQARNCSELWDITNGMTVCMKCHNRGNIRPIRSRNKKVQITIK